MTTTDVATSDGRAPRLNYPSPRVKQAIREMIESGASMQAAAQQAGLTTHALRLALEKPSVLAFMRSQRQVFRAAISCANDLRLAQIRDAADNMPAVNAIKLLEQIDDAAPGNSGASHSPHLTIRIVNQVAAPDILNQKDVSTIEATPALPNSLENEPGGEK